MQGRVREKRKRIIQALTDKPLTWNELLQETKLSEAALHRHLNALMAEGFVHKIPTVYSLTGEIKIVRPTEAEIVLTEDIKRVKRGDTKFTRKKIIPLKAVRKKRDGRRHVKCPKCNVWSLMNSKTQTCPNCGNIIQRH